MALIVLTVFAGAGCLHGGDSDERSAALTTGRSETGADPPATLEVARAPEATPGKDVPDGLEQQARRQTARQKGIAEDDVQLVSSSPATLPMQDRTVYQVKILDKSSGELSSVVLDDSGAEVDLERLLVREEDRREARYGKFDPELDGRLSSAGPDDRIRVSIRARERTYEPPDRPDARRIDPTDTDARSEARREADNTLSEARDQRRNTTRALLSRLEERLRELGEEFTADQYLPLLYAELTPETIRRVSRFPEVQQIALAPRVQSLSEIAKPTVGATYVNDTLGITGAGVRVAQIEVGGRVDTANSRLAGVANDVYASLCPAGGSQHSTGVAGIIRARTGVAPGTTLLATGDCNGNLPALQNRSSAAVTWGSRVQNHSWGNFHYRDPRAPVGVGQSDNFLTAADRFFDTLVYTTFTTVVFAAGNEGNRGSESWVMSPGRAYNVITVGNFDSKNSITWAGDTMSSSSSWVDPYSLNGDREEPDLAAPGQNTLRSGGYWSTVPLGVNSTGYGPIGEGTSYAAPAVAGAAALLIQGQPTLGTWPEVIRAILMATAVGNPDGYTPRYEPSVDKRDGAGGIWIPYAEQVARGSTGNWSGLTYACSAASPLNVLTMNLAAGRSMRAVIAWDTHPQYADYLRRPSVDLDLQVTGPNGAVVQQSSSYDNVHELVEFTPSTSGTYTIRALKHRCDLGPTYLGAAWSQP